MAGLKRCLGVDVGANSVKLVELTVEKNKPGITIQKVCEAPLELAPDAPEETRRATIIQAIRELIKSNRISTRQAVFSLPGQNVFFRRIRLPITTEERLARIIRFEARQQIPFPPDQTTLQWEVFEYPEEQEVEVVLAAIRTDIIDDYMTIVSKCGLQPIQISVSYFALYNYHVYSNRVVSEQEGAPPEEDKKAKKEKKPKKKKTKKAGGMFGFLKKKKDEEAEEEPEAEEDLEQPEEEEEEPIPEMEEVKAYVNLGASSFDLAIHRQSDRDSLGFVRSVPFAGNEVTRAIQKYKSIDSFVEAEEYKRQKVKVIVPGFEDEDSGKFDLEASGAITRPLDRIVSELRRSLDFYISQPDGMAVDTVLLSGGLTALTNLGLYLEDKIGVPVEGVDEPENPDLIRVDCELPSPYNRYLIGIGLALGGLGAAPININFLPRTQQVQIEFKKKYAQVALMLIFIGGMLAISMNLGSQSIRDYQAARGQMQTRISQLQALDKKKKELQKERQDLFDRFIKVGTALPVNQNYWFNFMLTLLQEKPTAVMFTNVDFDALGSARIDGLAENERSVASFMTNLKSNEFDIADFIDFNSVIQKLKNPPNEYYTKHVLDKLTTDTVNLLDDYTSGSEPSEQLTQAVINDFNQIIQGPSMWDPELMQQVNANSPNKVLFNQVTLNAIANTDPTGPNRSFPSRMVLEDLFKEGILHGPSYFIGDLQLLQSDPVFDYEVNKRMFLYSINMDLNSKVTRFQIDPSQFRFSQGTPTPRPTRRGLGAR